MGKELESAGEADSVLKLRDLTMSHFLLIKYAFENHQWDIDPPVFIGIYHRV